MTSLSYNFTGIVIILLRCQTLVLFMIWGAVVVAGSFAIVVYFFPDLVSLRSLDLDVTVLYLSNKAISKLST